MCKGYQQACPGLLAPRKVSDLRIEFETKLFSKLFRIAFIPIRVECARVMHQFADTHPLREIAVLREISDPGQNGRRIPRRRDAEYGHVSLIGAQRTE